MRPASASIGASTIGVGLSDSNRDRRPFDLLAAHGPLTKHIDVRAAVDGARDLAMLTDAIDEDTFAARVQEVEADPST